MARFCLFILERNICVRIHNTTTKGTFLRTYIYWMNFFNGIHCLLRIASSSRPYPLTLMNINNGEEKKSIYIRALKKEGTVSRAQQGRALEWTYIIAGRAGEMYSISRMNLPCKWWLITLHALCSLLELYSHPLFFFFFHVCFLFLFVI